jgi:hypothetical protein
MTAKASDREGVQRNEKGAETVGETGIMIFT